jgi:hypothetical protein
VPRADCGAYTSLVSVDEESDAGEDRRAPDFEEDEEDEDVEEAEPRSRWSTASELAGGLLALSVVTVGVWVAYLAFGVGFAVIDRVLATAAPAIGVLCAALFLAHYLSRR